MEERNIQQEINAAFDSVNLLKELFLIENKTQEDLDSIERNVGHLQYKMNDELFVSELTENQKIEISALI